MFSSSSSTLNKVIECCFPNFVNTELIFAIVQNLNTEKSIEGSPCSLMRFTVEERLKEALQEEETVNEINEIIRTHPIDLSHLHFFEDKPELLKIAFENSYSEKLGIFGLELRSSTCILTVERKYIAEIPVSETLEEAKYYINLAVAKGYLKFRLSVTEHPIGNETRRQKLERITEEIEKEYNREANECSIGCYIQRGFHFEKGTGSHIYFSKYVGKDDGICRHVANKSIKNTDNLFIIAEKLSY